MSLIVNPGSEPVTESTPEDALANIKVFADDLRKRDHDVVLHERIDLQDDGRFQFVVTVEGVDHEVDMPGWPVEEVRWLDESSGNIWDFPRLYVDGSSWVWKYALNQCEPGWGEE